MLVLSFTSNVIKFLMSFTSNILSNNSRKMRYRNNDSNVHFELIIMGSCSISLCNNKRIVINPYYKVVMELCDLYHINCFF